MPDYKNSKIYKLYVGDLVYIGSTAQPRLSLRLGQHKTAYKMWIKTGKNYVSSFELFKVGDPTIELVELFPCGSKDELTAHEGFHQRANPNCVNIKIEGRTKAEYYQANRQQIVERKRAYYQANAQQLIERQRAYCDANKEHIAERNRAYYQANKRVERLTLFIQKHIQSI